MIPRPGISVVVPFLNEERALPATLDALLPQLDPTRGDEAIAVDGGSDDASRELLARFPAVRVVAAARGRASQMNAGAATARGDVLLFLHADTLLPAHALDAIAEASVKPGFVYGGFRHRFSGDDARLRLISALHNFRCARARTFYGDQAMFVARSAFAQVGGFPAVQVEDIAISQRLRELGPPAFLPLAVVTDARKFVQAGVWRSFARVLAILVCLRVGAKPPQAFFADIR
jgi:rSAM/selenodomain-associated transferase 2